jgi:DNA-nicking Smr family endonuclease
MSEAPDEQDEWQALIKGVTPYSKPYLEPELEPIKRTAPSRDDVRALIDFGLKGDHLPPLKRDAYAGLNAGMVRKLKRGQLPIDYTLDLHGMTQAQAYQALQNCLAQSYQAGKRVLLVITGKGSLSKSGVLREALPNWLNDSALRPYMLAFGAARREDGGSGAFYVLLKKRKTHG